MAAPGFNTVPRNADGSFDKIAVRDLYMQSRHLDWTEFARSKGWDPQGSRGPFPVRSWKNSKKRLLAKQHAEEFESLTYDDVALWKKEVIRTMREYPASIEKIKFLADYEVDRMMREVAEARSAGKKVPPLDLDRLDKCSQIQSRCVQDKHKALLLNTVSLQLARDPMITGSQGGTADGQEEKLIGFSPESLGTSHSLQDITAAMAKYYDRPQEDPIEVTPTPQPVNTPETDFEDEA